MGLTVNSSTDPTINLWYGEIKKLTFTYNVDLTGATFELRIRDNDTNALVKTVPDGDFDKSEIGDKKISYTLDTTDTLTADNTYELNIMVLFTDGTKDISEILYLKLNE